MKYLLTQTIILFTSVFFLYYFVSQKYFIPANDIGDLNWRYIALALFLFALTLQAILWIVIYLILAIRVKFTPNKKNVTEDSSKEDSKIDMLIPFKWSIIISILFILILLLNLFHFLTFWWGIGLASLIIIILLYFK